MPNAYKVLGQLKPAATTLTTLYTVPSATSVVLSTITVCNLGVSALARIAVRPAGASIDDKHYLVYDTTINANDTLVMTLGITLATTDVISVYSGSGNVSFSVFGTEIT